MVFYCVLPCAIFLCFNFVCKWQSAQTNQGCSSYYIKWSGHWPRSTPIIRLQFRLRSVINTPSNYNWTVLSNDRNLANFVYKLEQPSLLWFRGWNLRNWVLIMIEVMTQVLWTLYSAIEGIVIAKPKNTKYNAEQQLKTEQCPKKLIDKKSTSILAMCW